MTSRTLSFRVEVNFDCSISAAEMRDYIKDAVQYWAKGGNPDDPLFDLTDGDIRVTGWRERASDVPTITIVDEE